MKTTKVTAWILAAVLCVETILAGCGNTEGTEGSETVEGTVVTEEGSMQEIGDATASLEIQVTNEMGSAITGLSVKSPSETEYPDNMMTADQKIEDGETVTLFYEPVAEVDSNSAEGEAVKPDVSYIGFWNEAGYDDCELTILDVSEDSVTFHIWWDHDASTEESVVATFDSENVGTFSTLINGDKEASGTITFYNDSIDVRILKSASDDVHVGSLGFDERHDSSWENGEDLTLAEEENPEDESEEVCDKESSYSLQVTMENGDVYELSCFDVEDMEEVTLYLEDGVAYIEYMSLSQNVMISTKKKEQEVKADKEAAQVVIDMIAAIGTVTAENAEEHRDEIEAAREAYDALTDAQKGYVTNVASLEEMESLLGTRSNGTKATEAGDSNAYNEGIYCGDSGYTKEDAEARAAELGYASGSKAYQDFWDGYDYGLNNRDEGDFYTIGKRIGEQGYSEEEARAEYTRDGSIYDPKSRYVKDYWEGYYVGYAEYEASVQSAEGDGDEYEWGMWCAEQGMTEAEAKADAASGGLTSDSPHYQDFLDGYYAGLSVYDDGNAQEEQEPEEEEPEQDGDENLPEGEPVYY